MGPRHRDEDTYNHLNDILTQRDEQISELKIDVRAYALKTSAFHGRLLATVDALDRAKLIHSEELAAERRERKKLNVQLRAHVMALEEAEAERDSLREAVMELIEKVEINNNYSLWPHSSIQMTSPLAPGRTKLTPEGARTDPNAAFRSYATSMIASLRADYEHERQAHARTNEELSMRNAVLEAMVAQREAELERHLAPTKCTFCARSSGPRAVSLASQSRYDVKTEEDVPRLTREDAIRYQEALATRNRELKAEVEGLAERLERARPVFYPPNPQLKLNSDRILPMPSHGGPTEPRDHPPRPHSSPPSAPEKPRFGSATNAKPSLQNDHQSPPIARPGGTRTYSTNDDISPTALDDQIDALVLQLEQLRIQKRRLERPSEAKQPTPAQPTDRSFGKILVLEQECIRLRNAEREAVRKLQDAQEAAREREHSLEAEIERLKQTQSGPPEQQRSRDEEYTLDPLDDEVSMDLATPLQPTVLLPQPSDPPTVPLPPSPPEEHEGEENWDSWRLSPAMPVFELDTAELERVRFSLNAAEIQLREKDAELVKLRSELSARAGHDGLNG